MTKCSCGKTADIIERGTYVCATCWITLYSKSFKTYITWRYNNENFNKRSRRMD